MFFIFKLISVSFVVIILIITYVKMSDFEPPILASPKKEVQVFLQQEEIPRFKDECKSYIVTNTRKICLPQKVYVDKNDIVGKVDLNNREDTRYVVSLQNTLDYPKENTTDSIQGIGTRLPLKADLYVQKNNSILISPFAKETP